MGSNCVACHSGIEAPPHGTIAGAHTHADLATTLRCTARDAHRRCRTCRQRAPEWLG